MFFDVLICFDCFDCFDEMKTNEEEDDEMKQDQALTKTRHDKTRHATTTTRQDNNKTEQ